MIGRYCYARYRPVLVSTVLPLHLFVTTDTDGCSKGCAVRLNMQVLWIHMHGTFDLHASIV